MSTTRTETSFLTKTKLKERGWSDRMIREFLGPPDRKKRNHRHGSKNRICLYKLRRVEDAERTPEFARLKAEAQRRRQVSLAAAEVQRRQTIASVSQRPPIRVPLFAMDELTRRAVEHYGWRHPDETVSVWNLNEDSAFLNRLRVNYLRHVCTGYDRWLQELQGKIGKANAVDVLREVMFDAISDQYPDLAAECDRQQIARLVWSYA